MIDTHHTDIILMQEAEQPPTLENLLKKKHWAMVQTDKQTRDWGLVILYNPQRFKSTGKTHRYVIAGRSGLITAFEDKHKQDALVMVLNLHMGHLKPYERPSQYNNVQVAAEQIQRAQEDFITHQLGRETEVVIAGGDHNQFPVFYFALGSGWTPDPTKEGFVTKTSKFGKSEPVREGQTYPVVGYQHPTINGHTATHAYWPVAFSDQISVGSPVGDYETSEIRVVDEFDIHAQKVRCRVGTVTQEEVVGKTFGSDHLPLVLEITQYPGAKKAPAPPPRPKPKPPPRVGGASKPAAPPRDGYKVTIAPIRRAQQTLSISADRQPAATSKPAEHQATAAHLPAGWTKHIVPAGRPYAGTPFYCDGHGNTQWQEPTAPATSHGTGSCTPPVTKPEKGRI